MIPATYYDGRTAAARPVIVSVDAAGLVLQPDSGGAAVRWHHGSFRVASQDSGKVTLETKDEVPAILAGGYELLAAIRMAHPEFEKRTGARLALKVAFLAGPALLGGYVVFAHGLPLFGRGAAWLVPLQWEDRLGKSVAGGFVDGKECLGGDAPQAIRGIVARLSAAQDSKYRFAVRIADLSDVNALAAPGGRIVVFRGLIRNTASAEELAAVLAHEMQHVVQRHGMSALMRGLGLSAAVSVIIGDPSFLVTAGAFLSEMHFHREDEERADREAMRMLERARIDPYGMVKVMKMLSGEGPKLEGAMKYLSTHPMPQDRIAWAEAAARAAKYEIQQLAPGVSWPPSMGCAAR